MSRPAPPIRRDSRSPSLASTQPDAGEAMSLIRPHYATRYGYRWTDAIRAEFWWRVEHSFLYTRWHVVNAHRRRKEAERRGNKRGSRGF